MSIMQKFDAILEVFCAFVVVIGMPVTLMLLSTLFN